jgi:hypothetical protein
MSFKLTQSEISNMEYIVDRWIKVKEQHAKEYIPSDSLHVRDITVRGVKVEVGFFIAPCEGEQ